MNTKNKEEIKGLIYELDSIIQSLPSEIEYKSTHGDYKRFFKWDMNHNKYSKMNELLNQINRLI